MVRRATADLIDADVAVARPGEMRGETGAMEADIGNRGDLPEGAAGDRPKGKQAARDDPFVVDDRTLLGDVEAKSERIRTNDAAGYKVAEQRVLGGEVIALWTGAVYRPCRLQRLLAARSAMPDVKRHPQRRGLQANNARRLDGQLASLHRGVNHRADLGSETVAMHFPPRAKMAKEATALFDRQPPP